MKEVIKKILREAILVEKTIDINDDVDLIYERYFKADIDQIQKTGFIEHGMFRRKTTNTSILKEETSKEADKIGRCLIQINYGHNYYNPYKSVLSISINPDAVNFVLKEAGGDLHKAKKYLNNMNKAKSLVQEFTEEKVKGSIHHELVHWIDNVTHNKHLNKTRMGIDTEEKRDLIDMHYLEINSQIHNIVQLKRKHSDIWDLLTFIEMIRLSPTLALIYDSTKIPKDIKMKWMMHLKKRMYREGLLGDHMYERQQSTILEKDDRCTRIAKRKYDTWPSAYASGAVVRCRKGEIWKDIKEDDIIDEKTDYSKEKDKGLHGWFERQGGEGKSSGWVDCNTCRKDPKTGRKKCKPCGREKGEKRAKYPACRPTPSACKTKGKGEKWGKKSKKNENVLRESRTMSAKEIADYITYLTPEVENVPDYFIRKIKASGDEFSLKKLKISDILEKDKDVKNYVDSGEDRYYGYDMNTDELYDPIVIFNDDVMDGYSRLSQLNKLGEEYVEAWTNK